MKITHLKTRWRHRVKTFHSNLNTMKASYVNLLGLLKIVMITETWLSSDTSLTNRTGYSLLSSPRTFGRGGCA